MVVFQCKKCDKEIRIAEGNLTNLICQSCSGNEFTFDGGCSFESKDGDVTKTDGNFTSENPHLYIINRLESAKKESEQVVKKYEPEKEEEIEIPKVKPLKKPKRVRAPRVRKVKPKKK